MHDLCYQCSKDGPDLSFGSLKIRNKNMNNFFLQKNHMNTK